MRSDETEIELVNPKFKVVCANLTLLTPQKAQFIVKYGGGSLLSRAAFHQQELDILLKYKRNGWCKIQRNSAREALLKTDTGSKEQINTE